MADVGKAATGDSFWDQAVFAVKGSKGTATGDGWVVGAGLGNSGRFEMDPETAEGMVQKARWIANEMQTNHLKAKNLVHSEPPAEDPGSQAFQKVAHQMFELGSSAQEAQWKRYVDIAEKLERALDVYKGTDEQAGRDAKKSGGGLIG